MGDTIIDPKYVPSQEKLSYPSIPCQRTVKITSRRLRPQKLLEPIQTDQKATQKESSKEKAVW